MKNFWLLVLVSAIWGSSFIFMRVLSPIYGGYFVAFSRMFIGGIFTLIYAKIVGVKFDFKNNFKHYLFIAFFNGALPLTCFSLAAVYIDASLSAILNSTSSILASIYGIYFLKEKLSIKQIFGLMLAFFSLLYITVLKDASQDIKVIGIILALIATNGYAISSIYISLKAKNVDSRAFASVSTFMGSMLLLPLAFSTVQIIDSNYVFHFLFLGIMCTGVAYLIYFYLIKNIGVKALSTTFLQPIFGSIWAVLFLGEIFTLRMAVTTLLIVLGVYVFLSDKIKGERDYGKIKN